MAERPSPYQVTVDAQRRAAEPDASAWVSANAGAGKTRVLTDRVIRLMLAGAEPSHILSITYTRAAAAEMSNRLFDRLGSWATSSDRDLRAYLIDLAGEKLGGGYDLDAARRLFARALETPGGLKIQTIHAFSESVLRRFPLESGLSPEFKVADEADTQAIITQLKQRLYRPQGLAEEIAGSMDRLLQGMADGQFDRLVMTMIMQRAMIEASLLRNGGVDGVIASLRGSLHLGEDDTRDKVRRDGVAHGSWDELGLRRVVQALGKDTTKGGINQRDVLTAWLASDDAGRLDLLETYMGLYLTQKGEARKRLLSVKPAKADPLAVGVLEEEQVRVLELADRLRAAVLVDLTADILTVAERLLSDYAHEKQRRALLDYQDQIDCTLRLLQSQAAWVHYKLDQGISHILIDEAQDTSPAQWQIIELLSAEFHTGASARPGPRTVFAVGDEKQSIYSFQGADPAGFARMRRHFHDRVADVDGRFQDVPLALSFRSAPAVLEAVDAVFAGEPGAQFDTPDGIIRHDANRAGAQGLVELWPLEEPSEQSVPDRWRASLDVEGDDSPRRRLARRIAGHVRQMIDSGEAVGDPCALSPVRPRDVLILVRRREPLVDEIARALKDVGVPVAGADRMSLTQQIAVMDLMVLGDFLLLPEDDLALATVLKSPLFNLDDDDLFALAHGREKHQRLWPLFRQHAAERPKWLAALTELQALLALVDQIPPFEFYSRLLGAGGGRRRLIARLGPDQLDPLDEFLNAALADERDHPPSMQGFLHRLRQSETEIKRDMDQGQDAVRIMTVHGAKGLEAPVVILPDTVRIPQSRPEGLQGFAGSDGQVVPVASVPAAAAPDRLAQQTSRNRDETVAEYNRLLYVAMTRARDRLYVCGYYNSERAGPAEGCWYNSVRDALMHMGTEIAPGLWRLGQPQTRSDAPEDVPVVPTLPKWALQAAPTDPVPPRPLAPSRPGSADPAVASPVGDANSAGRQRGRLLHQLLQVLPEIAETERRSAGQDWLGRRARDLDPDIRTDLLDEALGVIQAPEIAEVFAPGSRAEVAVTGLVGRRVVSGQIDRLSVNDDRVLIVDFKGNRPPPDSAADVPRAYLHQMALYRALIRQIYPDHDVQCALVWTWQTRLMPLSSAQLDDALASLDLTQAAT